MLSPSSPFPAAPLPRTHPAIAFRGGGLSARAKALVQIIVCVAAIVLLSVSGFSASLLQFVANGEREASARWERANRSIRAQRVVLREALSCALGSTPPSSGARAPSPERALVSLEIAGPPLLAPAHFASAQHAIRCEEGDVTSQLFALGSQALLEAGYQGMGFSQGVMIQGRQANLLYVKKPRWQVEEERGEGGCLQRWRRRLLYPSLQKMIARQKAFCRKIEPYLREKISEWNYESYELMSFRSSPDASSPSEEFHAIVFYPKVSP